MVEGIGKMSYKPRLLSCLSKLGKVNLFVDLKDGDFAKFLDIDSGEVSATLMAMDDKIFESVVSVVSSTKETPGPSKPVTNPYTSLLVGNKVIATENESPKKAGVKMFEKSLFSHLDFKSMHKKDIPQRMLFYLNNVQEVFNKKDEACFYMELVGIAQTHIAKDPNDANYEVLTPVVKKESGEFLKFDKEGFHKLRVWNI